METSLAVICFFSVLIGSQTVTIRSFLTLYRHGYWIASRSSLQSIHFINNKATKPTITVFSLSHTDILLKVPIFLGVTVSLFGFWFNCVVPFIPVEELDKLLIWVS